MKLNIKAALLSAFVLPGLGQVLNGRRLKGFLLIFSVNIFILAALVFVLKGMSHVMLAARTGGTVDPQAVLAQVRHSGGSGPRWLLALFSGIWLYAVIDALTTRPPADTGAKGPDESD